MKDFGLLESYNALTGRIVTYTKGKANWMAETSTNLVFSFLSSFLTIILVLTVSVFLYGTFYYAYVPIDVYKVPLDLQFEPCNETRLRCSYPRGELSLGRAIKLNPGQSYTLSSRLALPDNEVNEEHGMFMTCLTISSGKGSQLDQSCKASILQYRSSLLKMIETLAFLPSLLVGLTAQKQEILIDFFDKFELDAHNPGEILTLEILSKNLEVSDVTLDIHADLKGLKLLMYQHPWISMVIGISVNMLLLSSIILMSWTSFLGPNSGGRRTEAAGQAEVEEDGVPNPASTDRLFLLKTIFVALIMIILLISGSAY